MPQYTHSCSGTPDRTIDTKPSTKSHVPIASYGLISTSSIAHHAVWTAAITSAARVCTTDARKVGGTIPHARECGPPGRPKVRGPHPPPPRQPADHGIQHDPAIPDQHLIHQHAPQLM